MAYRVVINGFGRVGRNVLRSYLERALGGQKNSADDAVEIVAINDIADGKTLAHLFAFDSTHGPLPWKVECTSGSEQAIAAYDIKVNDLVIPIFQCKDALDLPWESLQVDLVIECSGAYRYRRLAEKHIDAGAQRVVISAPAYDEVDATIVFGVNEEQIITDHRIMSAASCTTNALANIIQPLHDKFTIISGLVTEIHGYTSDQSLLDAPHSDLRRARSATQSMIPTATTGIDALKNVLPHMANKITGYSMRVPTVNVAAVDINLMLSEEVTVEDINSTLKVASEERSGKVLAYNELPLVSCDFNHHPASAVFDASLTQLVGNLVKVVAWYDNEWGYANRLLDLSSYLAELHLGKIE